MIHLMAECQAHMYSFRLRLGSPRPDQSGLEVDWWSRRNDDLPEGEMMFGFSFPMGAAVAAEHTASKTCGETSLDAASCQNKNRKGTQHTEWSRFGS